MDNRNKAKQILANMIFAGQDVAPPAWVDSWTDDEVMYIIDNYGPYYLS